ncbi:MAG: hypothetical protein Q4B28_07440 [bacterium]|nr:hypothetical protein [bacterium]
MNARQRTQLEKNDFPQKQEEYERIEGVETVEADGVVSMKLRKMKNALESDHTDLLEPYLL